MKPLSLVVSFVGALYLTIAIQNAYGADIPDASNGTKPTETSTTTEAVTSVTTPKATVTVTSKPTTQPTTTTRAPLPVVIQTTIYNGIRTLGNAVRFVPATLTDFFKNISRTSTQVLRRNTTGLILPSSTTAAPSFFGIF